MNIAIIIFYNRNKQL